MVLHEKQPRPDIVHKDVAGAEHRLHALKDGFRKVSGRWDRRLTLKSIVRGLVIPTAAVLCSFVFFWWLADP